ncbi:thioredoxin family protein [Flavisolibacter ginsengisoli]|uniref:Thiol-disulfide isomerase or thioredoxin n=1 Tax=Flavisolibacter ginsengisoli DSM 18119 TaxID=1121884 RepID=A0A1M5DJM8_9BACT|nr:thioredoxin family protein [Flavisolibacter ginsengisoli]SHF67094.1 Thiol-disulfide isomerase or thioredoxin [Flavisolibacter ginsengisoli DSM 18119]
MKKILLLTAILFSTCIVFAQSAEISHDPEGNKIIKGFISRQELANDSSFTWFLQNQKDYTPDQSALKALRANKDSINIIAFGGTWCSDTKYILPKFYVLSDASGLSPDRITLIGVDHNKKTIQHLSEAFNVINVPTFIVMKNGKEIGRVVEYGTTGMFDRELGQIIAGKTN